MRLGTRWRNASLTLHPRRRSGKRLRPEHFPRCGAVSSRFNGIASYCRGLLPMANIAFADTTGHYDGRSVDTHPLGATETSVIYLARELARRKHDVTVFTHCDAAIEHDGVHWRPLGSAVPDACDLFVAVQHTELLGLVRSARRQAIWILWQPNHLDHFRRIWRMWWHRPVPVFASQYQVRTYVPLMRRVPDVPDD